MCKKIDELEIPNEVMPSVCIQLEKLVKENRITMEMVKNNRNLNKIDSIDYSLLNESYFR